MKKFLIMAVMLLTLAAAPAHAQFRSKSKVRPNSQTTYTLTEDEDKDDSKSVESYNRLGLNYLHTYFTGTNEIMLNVLMTGTDGFSAGVMHGMGLSEKLPIFMEFGGMLNYGHWSNTMSNTDMTLNTLSLVAPVNAGYKFKISDNFSISPFIGLNLKLGLVSSCTIADDEDDETYNFYDKDDAGGRDYVWSRVQLGYQFGTYFDFNKFYATLQYGDDFNSLAKNWNTSHFSTGIGLRF